MLQPGGRFFCLEFSRVQVAVLQPLYDAWSFRVLPVLGDVVARDEASYRYLAESIRTFPDQDALAEMMRRCGIRARCGARSVRGDRGNSFGMAAVNGQANVLPLPSREGALGGGRAVRASPGPLPPTPSRKGRGRMDAVTDLSSRRVLLIVSGGIAAYKALELIRLLRGRGYGVGCVLTERAHSSSRRCRCRR